MLKKTTLALIAALLLTILSAIPATADTCMRYNHRRIR